MSAEPAEAATNGTEAAPVVQDPKKVSEAFSWLNPHPIFVIVLVGRAEQPFGIQKDFLCHRSEHYRKYFEANSSQDTLEHVVKLPESTAEEFGLVQHFLYTGQVIADAANIPSYESLVGLWRLGNRLGIDGLCDQTLDAMKTCKRLTQRIPATPLLVQVWRDTPEGSTIRNLLLSWTAEYMRSSDARADFAKTLPQEVLSELVVAMSSFNNAGAEPEPLESPSSTATTRAQKNIHYLDQGSDDESLSVAKRGRRSSGAPFSSGSLLDPKPTLGRKPSRVSSLAKPQKRRPSAMFADPSTFTTAQKMDFCADLLTRMLSGPGFWTRLVGPFREPVVPSEDGVPDYFDKIKKPMDLSTMKSKMDRREYADEAEFLVDMRQIFDNCFTYWKKGTPMYAAGEKLQKTFEDKYSAMNKWIAKMGGDDAE